jgi:hypothetical protein
MKDPTPRLVKCDDGSTLCEWITKNWRFGISIEKNIEESNWYFVYKDPMIGECGTLPKRLIETIKQHPL